MQNEHRTFDEWDEIATVQKIPPQQSASRAIPWRLDVLVVDDDRADAWLIMRALRDDWRVYRTILAESAESALYQLAEGVIRPHVILLDINMPKVDGFKFLDALKEIPAMAGVPVVMLTTSRYAKDVEKAREKKARSYLIKPDDDDVLRKRLAEVLTEVMREWRRQWNT
jgi:CheY-like chemotaxis protein